MTRAISLGLRRALEEPRSSEYVVVLLEITHPLLATSIRVANDVVSYNFEGNTYIGFPFELEILSDSKNVPRGQLRVQNVDRRISEAIIDLVSPPKLRIILLANSDFSDTLTDNERTPVSDDIQPEYEASNLVFANVSVDAMSVSGEIMSFDMSSEPWPGIRSTADRLPGLDP